MCKRMDYIIGLADHNSKEAASYCKAYNISASDLMFYIQDEHLRWTDNDDAKAQRESLNSSIRTIKSLEQAGAFTFQQHL